MTRTGRLLAVMVLVAVACTTGGNPAASSTASQLPRLAFGGTLRAALVVAYIPNFDPQRGWDLTTNGVLSCLLRTLLSYSGRPTDQGGAELRPDLARSMPDVSSDGLTWTFRLRSGLHYAPPFQATEMVAGDVVRALEREARVHGPYAFYYDVIQGFSEAESGAAASISGLVTPDDHTLVVHLTKPAGDLGNRLAMPAAAPIPSGAAEGHPNYGRYLVASGPYMFEGSQNLDFSEPARDQAPVSGYIPEVSATTSYTEGSITLVRNPSWRSSTDPLRAAYVDRIEISIGGWSIQDLTTYSQADGFADEKTLFDKVVNGQLDVVLDVNPPLDQLRSLRADPQTAELVRVNDNSYARNYQLNLAVPPLDDIHVRKAMVLALDRTSLRELRLKSVSEDTQSGGAVPDHIAPDALEGGLLLNYRPSWMTTPAGGNLQAARAQMALSKYDRTGDGICDASVCKHLRLVEALASISSPDRSLEDAVLKRGLGAIGIEFQVQRYAPDIFSSKNGPLLPAARSALQPGTWGVDFPNGSGWFPVQFSSENLLSNQQPYSVQDFSMLGATPNELRRWGYKVRHVPNVDERLQRCVTEIGNKQVFCWARLDQYLMEKVVPWIPILFGSATRLVSSRVAHYSFDQATGTPALDQFSLTSSAINESP